MKFLHAADIHLDSPLRGLSRYEGAPVDELRGATRHALRNLVDLAIDEQVDFLLIAGDVYDGDWKDHNTGLYFVSQMARLRQSRIPVVMISGNHDAANRMTRSLPLPDNVTCLSHHKPESHPLEKLDVVVHGRSFARAAEYENFASLYPPRTSGCFNIGLLHTSLTGAAGHEPYAPCSLDDLRQKEYDYWALGHVHTREVKCESPWVVYPGNIQGRHIREAGAKGCYLVNVDASGSCQLEFRTLDVLRWQELHVDVSGTTSTEEVVAACGNVLSDPDHREAAMPQAVRLRLTGRSSVHQSFVAHQEHWVNQIRAAAITASNSLIWIEKIKFEVSRRDAQDVAEDPDGPLLAVVDSVRQLQSNQERLSALAAGLADLRKKLPDDILSAPDGILLDDPQYMAAVIEDVESLLMQRLSEGPAE